MKLSADADTRARLRMLRMWVTPEQYRDMWAGLEQVEVPPRKTLRQRIDVVLYEARRLALAWLRRTAGVLGRTRVMGEASRLRR